MKKFAFFLIILFSAAGFAQPQIAVYVTGDVPDDERSVLGTSILASLANSGRYIGRPFLAEINPAARKGGGIDNRRISELGRPFGVQFVCVADITPANDSFHVSARIVDVETAAVVFIGKSSFGQLESMADLAVVSDKIVKNMLGSKTMATPEPSPPTVSQARIELPKPKPEEKQYLKSRSLEKRIGFEVGGAILPYFYHEYEEYVEYESWRRNKSDEYSGMGWGGYMRIDLIYVEIIPVDAFTADHSYGTTAILAKYPIVYKAIKVSPILGFGGFGRNMTSFIGYSLGGRIDIGINEIAYLRSEYLYGFLDDGWAASFKLGGGFDIGLGKRKKTYLRAELLYNWYGEYTNYRGEYYIDEYKETIQYIDLRAGIGYKWGGGGKKPKLPDPSKQRF